MTTKTNGQVTVRVSNKVAEQLNEVAGGLGLPLEVLADQVLLAFVLMVDQEQPVIQLPIRIKELRHKEG